jgi:hypothetical protein
MADDDPISYQALPKGARVLTSTGAEIGVVEHVLKDDSLDLFDGLAVKTPAGLRFVDANQVGTITTAAVHTTVTDDAVASLPQPDGDPVFEADPEEYQGNGLTNWFGRMFMREHWTRKDDE